MNGDITTTQEQPDGTLKSIALDAPTIGAAALPWQRGGCVGAWHSDYTTHASANLITAWQDLSGCGHGLTPYGGIARSTWTATGAEPLGTYTPITGAHSVGGGGIALDNQAFTVIWIGRPTSATTYGSGGIILNTGATNYTPGIQPSTGYTYLNGPGRYAAPAMLNPSGFSSYAVSSDAAAASVYVNGVKHSAAAYNAGNVTVSTLFGDAAAGQYGTNDATVAVLIFSRPIYEPEMQEILAYFGASQKTPTLTLVGDSIAKGEGLSTTSQRFTHLAALRLGYSINIGGVSSRTMAIIASQYTSTKFIPVAGGRNVHLVFAGTNDIASAVGAAAATIANTYTLCAAIRAADPFSKIVLTTPLPRAASFSGGQSSAGFEADRQTIKAEFAANYAAHADFLLDFAADATFGTQAAASDVTKYPDGVHPSATTNALMAQALVNILTESKHKSSHATGGSDALAPADIGAAAAFAGPYETNDLAVAGGVPFGSGFHTPDGHAKIATLPEALDVAIFGDSRAAQTGYNTGSGLVLQANGIGMWMQMATGYRLKLWRNPFNAEAASFSEGGKTFAQLLDDAGSWPRVKQLIDTVPSGTVVCMYAGTNGISDPSTNYNNFVTCVTRLRAAGLRPIAFVEPYYGTGQTGSLNVTQIQTYNASVMAYCAANHIPYIDIRPDYTVPGATESHPYLFNYDGGYIHPNIRGASIVGTAFARKIESDFGLPAFPITTALLGSSPSIDAGFISGAFGNGSTTGFNAAAVTNASTATCTLIKSMVARSDGQPGYWAKLEISDSQEGSATNAPPYQSAVTMYQDLSGANVPAAGTYCAVAEIEIDEWLEEDAPAGYYNGRYIGLRVQATGGITATAHNALVTSQIETQAHTASHRGSASPMRGGGASKVGIILDPVSISAGTTYVSLTLTCCGNMKIRVGNMALIPIALSVAAPQPSAPLLPGPYASDLAARRAGVSEFAAYRKAAGAIQWRDTLPNLVAVMGDSITEQTSAGLYGMESGGYATWARIFGGSLWDLAPNGSVMEFATSGWNSEQIRTTHLPQVLASSASICVVACGVNDFAVPYTSAVSATRIRGMWASLKAAGIIPVATTILPDNTTVGSPTARQLWIAATNILLRQYAAADGITLCDWAPAWEISPGVGATENTNYAGGDYLHPNTLGASKLGRRLKAALATLPLDAHDNWSNTNWITQNSQLAGTAGQPTGWDAPVIASGASLVSKSIQPDTEGNWWVIEHDGGTATTASALVNTNMGAVTCAGKTIETIVELQVISGGLTAIQLTEALFGGSATLAGYDMKNGHSPLATADYITPADGVVVLRTPKTPVAGDVTSLWFRLHFAGTCTFRIRRAGVREAVA